MTPGNEKSVKWLIRYTAILAVVFGSIAGDVVFENILLGIGAGMVWGLIVFALLSPLSKFHNQYLYLVLHLVIIGLLVNVSSKPFELTLLKEDIDQQVDALKKRKLISVDSLYSNMIAQNKSNINKLRERLAERDMLREKYFQSYQCECNGTCGTGEKGAGTECHRKMSEWQVADAESQAESEETIRGFEFDNNQLEVQRKQYHETLKSSDAGLLYRLEALSTIKFRDDIVLNSRIDWIAFYNTGGIGVS